MLLLAVTNNIHGRNEGWFNYPTGSTDPSLPYTQLLCISAYSSLVGSSMAIITGTVIHIPIIEHPMGNLKR